VLYSDDSYYILRRKHYGRLLILLTISVITASIFVYAQA